MSAHLLMALFDSIYVVALAGWIGSALFLSSGVIPLIVNHLDAAQADELVGTFVPRYCVGGAICGALALSSMVAVPLCYPEYRGAKVGVQAVAIIACILITLYVGNSLTFALGKARATGASWRERVAPLSRRARSLNAVVLITASGLLVAFATREAPKTSGIVELTPQQRARYDRAIARVIEQIEVKYGFRQPSARRSTESTDPGPAIDEETIKEIESYYAQKRRKADTNARRDAAAKPASGNDTHPGFPPPSS